jgi:hypothetical protein
VVVEYGLVERHGEFEGVNAVVERGISGVTDRAAMAALMVVARRSRLARNWWARSISSSAWRGS